MQLLCQRSSIVETVDTIYEVIREYPPQRSQEETQRWEGPYAGDDRWNPSMDFFRWSLSLVPALETSQRWT